MFAKTFASVEAIFVFNIFAEKGMRKRSALRRVFMGRTGAC